MLTNNKRVIKQLLEHNFVVKFRKLIAFDLVWRKYCDYKADAIFRVDICQIFKQ